MYRLKRIAQLANGKTLDIGYAAKPNPFLRGEVYGLDQETAPTPPNYKATLTGDASQLAELDERFDSITAGEIIEHLDNPRQFLADCYQILKPGGRLIISTPNPYYPPFALTEWLMSPRFFFSHDHVYIFPPRFLVRLMQRHGFEQVKTYSGGLIIPFILKELPFPRPFCYAIIYAGTKPGLP
jgi:SAM-dependent methyltransferase